MPPPRTHPFVSLVSLLAAPHAVLYARCMQLHCTLWAGWIGELASIKEKSACANVTSVAFIPTLTLLLALGVVLPLAAGIAAWYLVMRGGGLMHVHHHWDLYVTVSSSAICSPPDSSTWGARQVGGAYRGMSACLLRDTSQSVCYYLVADALHRTPKMQQTFGSSAPLFAGAITGVAHCLVEFPFDTIKTRYQTTMK